MPSTHPVYPVLWQTDRVLLIDQTRLPQEVTWVEVLTADAMATAIKTMIVRGAPAIGVAAGYGMYLGARDLVAANPSLDHPTFLTELEAIAVKLRATRPTAVNLFWAIDRMTQAAQAPADSLEVLCQTLLAAAQQIQQDDLQTCQQIGDHGVSVLPASPAKLRLLTHCNAGALATAGYGTALGVVRSAWREERLERVYSDETRPRLQGSKLTTWECVQEGIPVTQITDNMAAHCMQQGMIDLVVVGADRITANGDAANKIGTYSLAIVAHAHNVPFYVAAPLSTIDFKLADGREIPIEERDPSEVYQIGETRLCPEGVEFYNPAFDVTPARYITGIITEFGVFKPEELRSALAHRVG
ncbi:MAG: S-methyl-5-thioribose-1-phosphate isomerase [Synechococcales bacterium]|nr:S-methyl-5-thioribose-1-phosphate isomerase [Synechococcales bacterium]